MSHSQVLEWISGSFIQSIDRADVMAEFHVLDALGHGERGGSSTQPALLRLPAMTSRAATSRHRLKRD